MKSEMRAEPALGGGLRPHCIMDPYFLLTDIEYAYTPDVPVLNGVSLALAAGERVALTGKTGAGKTTLLQVMAGLKKPQRGTVHAFGRLRRTERDFHEVRLKAGLLMSDPDDQLFCATVAEDMAFGPFNLGWPRARVQAAVDAMLDRVGLSHCRDRSPAALSQGEKRMAALATLLVMEPSVLLLDEPTSGLDAAYTESLVTLLTASRAAVLMASHDEAFLRQVATRWCRLDRGSVKALRPKNVAVHGSRLKAKTDVSHLGKHATHVRRRRLRPCKRVG